MPVVPMSSSAIASIEYAPIPTGLSAGLQLTTSLTITFRNGRSYSYDDVPFDIVQALQTSDSPGAYYDEKIKSVFARSRGIRR